MNNYEKLYWLTRLDSIQTIGIIFLVLSIIGLLIYYICAIVVSDDNDTPTTEFCKEHKALRLWLWWIFIIVLFLLTFIPSKREAIFIMAGGKTMDFVQSDSSINKLPSQTTLLISKYLENKLDSLSK